MKKGGLLFLFIVWIAFLGYLNLAIGTNSLSRYETRGINVHECLDVERVSGSSKYISHYIYVYDICGGERGMIDLNLSDGNAQLENGEVGNEYALYSDHTSTGIKSIWIPQYEYTLTFTIEEGTYLVFDNRLGELFYSSMKSDLYRNLLIFSMGGFVLYIFSSWFDFWDSCNR